MALWGGRFEKDMADIVKEFNASIAYDQRMYNEDIDGSLAHVRMLAAQGIIAPEERDQIIKGLETIRARIAAGEAGFNVEDEDIHMGVESRLIAEIGDVGKKLHTARSRNDQNQVDMRLYMRHEIDNVIAEIAKLEEVLAAKAEEYVDLMMPGFTHMQHAQPITAGFYFMAYFQMFKRDIQRLQAARERLNQNPLGSCALAGTTLPIDRFMTTEELGFSAPTENAMDTVADRDYILDFLSAAATSMMHLSRMSEEIVWYSSTEFSYLWIDDSFCTGSSIMPQKKNPDIAELLRGKPGRVYGDLMSALTIYKGTPLSFDKDFQEEKEATFDAIDTWKASIAILREHILNMRFRGDVLEAQLEKGYLNATDIAEHLVTTGMPFREAHELVGELVHYCESKGGIRLEDMTDADMKAVDPRMNREKMGDISVEACVNARKSFGGTAPSEVRRQIAVAKEWLDSITK